MPRTPRITRTIPTTVATVLILNIETGIAEQREVSIPRKFKNMEKLRKAIEAKVNTETEKIAHIKSTKTVDLLYAMSEQFFIDHSEVLPPREKDVNKEEDENQDSAEENEQ